MIGRTYPEEFPRDIVLRAYDAAGAIAAADMATQDTAEELASSLLAMSDVAFLHARNRTNGCFMFQLDPAPEQG